MPKELNKVQIDAEVRLDVNSAKQQLRDLQSQLTQLSAVNNVKKSSFGLTDEIQKASLAATQLKTYLQDATNVDTGKLNLSKFSTSLSTAGISLKNLQATFSSMGATGNQVFSNLAMSILKAEAPMVSLNGRIKEFATTMANTARWQLSSSLLHGFIGALQTAYGYVQRLDRSLNDIRIVTGYSADRMADFALEANKAAKALNTTTTEYTKGALIFYQQGLSDDAVLERTNATIKLANTSGESAEDISSYMTAIWNNFDDGSKSIEHYADVLSYLGAVSAASNADIAEGMQSFAATASTVGLSYESAAAALTTLVDVTQQSASVVGNALKTIFARLSSLKLGETLEDGTDLTKYTKALETVGVNVLKANGDLKDMDTILSDLADRWETLNNSQKVALAQTVGGVRQYNNLISLMDNFDKFTEFKTGAEDSDGYLQSQADIYAQSWEAASKRVKASAQAIYSQLLDDKTFIKITDAFSKILDKVSALIDTFGGLKGVILTVSSVLLTTFRNSVTEGLISLTTNIAQVTGFGKKMAEDLKTQVQQSLAGMTSNLPNGELVTDTFQGMVNVQKTYESQISSIYGIQKQIAEKLLEQHNILVDNVNASAKDLEITEKKYNLLKRDTRRDVIDTAQEQGLGSGTTNVLTNMSSNSFKLQSQAGALSAVNEKLFGGEEEIVDTKQIDKVKKSMEALKDAFGQDLSKAVDSFGKRGVKALKEVDKALDSGKPEEVEKALEGVGRAVDKLGDNAESLRAGVNKKLGKEIIDDSTMIEAAERGSQVGNLIANNIIAKISEKDFGDSLAGLKTALGQIANSISGVLATLSLFASVLNLVNQGIDILSNPKTDGLEKFWKILTLIGTAMFTINRLKQQSIVQDTAKHVKDTITITLSALKAKLFQKEAVAAGEAAVANEALKLSTIEFTWILELAAVAVALLIAGLTIWSKVQEINNEKARGVAEANLEQAKSEEELISKTRELTDSVEELVESYKDLKDAGESTFDTLNDLKEQVPDLIDYYDELAEKLGPDSGISTTGLKVAYQAMLNGAEGAEDQLLAEMEKLDAIAARAQMDATQSGAQAAGEVMARQDDLQGKVKGTTYSLEVGGANTQYTNGKGEETQARDILNKYLSDYGENNNFNGMDFSVDLSDPTAMLEFYEGLQAAKDEMLKTMSANDIKHSDVYREISEELEILSGQYEELKEQATAYNAAALESFDITGFGFKEEDGQEGFENAASLNGMTNFETFDKQALIDAYAEQYGVSKDEALAALKKSNKYGTIFAAEEVFAAASTELTGENDENGDPITQINEQKQKLLEDWYDSLSDDDKKLALGLDLSFELNEDQSPEEATEKLNAQLAEAKEAALRSDYISEGAAAGLDTSELEKYADYISEVADGTGEFSDELQENSAAAALVSKNVMRMNRGIETLAKNQEEWVDILRNSNKESKEYCDALEGLKGALADILDVDVDQLPSSFLESEKNLKLVEEAANGSEEAINGLRDAASEAILTNIIDAEGFEGDAVKVRNLVEELKNFTDANEIKVGATIDTTGLEDGSRSFADICQDIIDNAAMTAEEAEAYFGSMGYQVNFATEEQPVVKHGHGTVTVTKEFGEKIIKNADGSEFPIPEGYQTFTYPGDPYEYVDYQEMIAMETSTDGKTKTPKINSVTKKASSKTSNYSSSNSGGKTSSGSSKSSSSTKTAKKSRYHENNQHLEATARELTRINRLEDSAFGAKKLDLLSQKANLLRAQANEYKNLANEAQSYLAADRQALYNLPGFRGFNSDGSIADYDSWYSSLSADQQESADELIKNYEEAWKTYQENAEKAAESAQQAFDIALEQTEYEVEFKIKLNEADADLLDFLINQIGDDAANTAASIALIGQQANKSLDNIKTYRNAIADVLGNHSEISANDITALMNGDSSAISRIMASGANLTADEIEFLQDKSKELISETEKLADATEEAFQKIGEAIDSYNEKLERQKDIISDSVSVLESYKNIADIVGRDKLGITSEMVKQMAQTEADAATRQLEIAKAQKAENESALEQLQQLRDSGQLTGYALEQLDKQIEEQEDRVRESANNFMSAWEEAAQKAADAFKTMAEEAGAAFSKAMGGAAGTLEELSDRFDKQKSLSELYLEDYKKIYELNKLNRSLEKSIDDTDNVLAKQKLLKLQDEINGMQQAGVEVSEHDIDIAQKKYDLYLAQIALEEAQNAKNQVRMSRDSEGNLSYVYTANQTAIDTAQQNYEDKLYALEESSSEYIDNMQSQILSALQEYNEALVAQGVDEQERTKLLEQYYTQLTATYGTELQKALDMSKKITDEFNVQEHNLVDSWSETLLSTTTGFTSLEEFLTTFYTSSTQATTDLENAYTLYNQNIENAMSAAGTSTYGFKDNVNEAMSEVQTTLDETAVAANKTAEAFHNSLNDATDAAKDFGINYGNVITNAIEQTSTLVASVNDLVKALSGLGLSSSAEYKAALDLGTSAATGFDTGGYTGQWGLNGKLAVLHEKELVLNAKDTENFLGALDILHNIVNAIDINSQSQGLALSVAGASGIMSNSQSLDQNVTIHAEFPNAVNHSEIEEAFNNLVNKASQYANRK